MQDLKITKYQMLYDLSNYSSTKSKISNREFINFLTISKQDYEPRFFLGCKKQLGLAYKRCYLASVRRTISSPKFDFTLR